MFGDKVWLRVGAPIHPKEWAGGQGGVPAGLLPLHPAEGSVRGCHGIKQAADKHDATDHYHH